MSANMPAMPTIPEPLGPSHLQQIKTALHVIAQAKNQIAKAKMAGVDTTQLEQQLHAHEKQLLAFKNIYFPNQ